MVFILPVLDVGFDFYLKVKAGKKNVYTGVRLNGDTFKKPELHARDLCRFLDHCSGRRC